MKAERNKMKKYHYIFKNLQEKIDKQELKIGEFLPNELELSKHYNVSRETIRKALKLLESAGLIEKMQGKGNKIIEKEQFDFPVSKLTSYKEIQKAQKVNSYTKVVSIDCIIVDAALEKLTGFPEKSKVWRIKRIRVIDGIKAIFDTDYLSTNIVPFMDVTIAQDSIYDYIENSLKLKIAFAKKEIIISNVTDEDILRLDLKSDKHIVLVSSQVYLENEEQFQFTESRHKLDKFKFVDYSRR